MSELHQLPPGTLIQNRYEIVAVIGQGGFGITYKGHDRKLDTPVAIKEYFPSGIVSRYHAMSPDVQVGGEENVRVFTAGKEKFLEEARTLAKFSDDPNTVSVHDFFEENQTVYIVMQYIEGESLDQYLTKKGTLTFDETFQLLRPVMQSLADIHKTGLIHRDISPSNLIIDRFGKIKLIDFGTARAISDTGEKSLSVMLKPGYSPSEQYNPHGKQGTWSDVYGLCASIYKLITGEKPVNALERLLSDTLPAPSELGAVITPSQEKALLKGMAIREEDRIRTMEELELAFAAAKEIDANGFQEERTVMGPSAFARSERPVLPETPASASKKPVSADAPSLPEKVQPVLQDTVSKETPVRAAAETNVPPVQERPVPSSKPQVLNKEKPPRKKAPFIIGVVVVLAALAVAAYFLFFSGGTGGGELEDFGLDGKIIKFDEMEITADALSQVDRNQKVIALSFSECSFSEEAIKRLGSIERIEYLSFYTCTFPSDLTPLSEIKALDELTISTYTSAEQTINGSELFGADFPHVTSLTMSSYQLTGGWEFLSHFPKVTYLTLSNLTVDETKSVFPDLPDLHYLYLSGSNLSSTDLSALGRSKDLDLLQMNEANLTDLSFLEGAEALVHVDVTDNRITDISALQNCPNLDWLHAGNNRIADISALKNCKQLENVILSNNRIEDISALASSTKIEVLSLNGNHIADLSPIKACEGMRELNISGNGANDLSFCENMLKLESLKASNNQIRSLDGLYNVTQLETVFLDGNAISDISVLAKNTEHLQTVVLDGNQISDLAPFSACPNLYAVSANNNLLTTLSGLENCAELYYVSAAGNQITDISALKSCAGLYAADLGENRLTDVSALGKSEAQTMALLLQNNQIKDISPLYGMKDYKYLVLYDNPVTDISGMSAMTSIDSLSQLYLSWWDGLDSKELAQTSFGGPKLVDTPADRQVNFQNEFSKAREESETFLGSIHFLTKEEADAEIAGLRSDARVAVGIEERKTDDTEES